MDELKEVWKTIKKYPRYQVSNLGRIKSLIGKEKILSPYINKKGYLLIELSEKPQKKGEYKTKKFRVHRLVAEYFCEGFAEPLEVHHKNLKRNDNRANNLICLTKKEHLELHKKINEEKTRCEKQQQTGDNNGS